MARKYWLDAPAQFEIRDGIVFCTFTSDGKKVTVRATIHNLLASMANASAVYAEHGGSVVSITPNVTLARGEAM